MKEINKIYEALLNRKEKVCHKTEIVKIINEYKKRFRSKIKLTNTLKYLSRHKYTKRIFQSYYYLNSTDERKRGFCWYEDKELLFIVLNKLSIKWYVGLDSALYLRGKSWQVPRVLHILNSKFSGEKRMLSLKVRFFRVKRSLFSGLEKEFTTNKIKFYYSNLDKTALDKAYLKRWTGKR